MARFKITFAGGNPNAATIAGRITDATPPTAKARRDAFIESIKPLQLDAANTFAIVNAGTPNEVRINFATADGEMECIMPDGTRSKDRKKYMSLMLNAFRNFTNVDLATLQLPQANIVGPAVVVANFNTTLTNEFTEVRTRAAAPAPAPVIGALFMPVMAAGGFQIDNVLAQAPFKAEIKRTLEHLGTGYKFRGPVAEERNAAGVVTTPAKPYRLVQNEGTPQEREIRIDALGGFRGPQVALEGAGAPANAADYAREADKIYNDIMASIAATVALDVESRGAVPPQHSRPFSIGVSGAHATTPVDTKTKFDAIRDLVIPKLMASVPYLYPNHTNLFVIANVENGQRSAETRLPGPAPRP